MSGSVHCLSQAVNQRLRQWTELDNSLIFTTAPDLIRRKPEPVLEVGNVSAPRPNNDPPSNLPLPVPTGQATALQGNARDGHNAVSFPMAQAAAAIAAIARRSPPSVPHYR
ncbi:MAG: hypothetical protein AMJ93_10175 [Anaerolineae bacterium SM23_84]|nr:MAG: hypothetical protein AMJ93_10175 [Anaerolineae bacterium SM23_84]